MSCNCASRAELIQVGIERLANGPFAVARHCGQALFVAGAAPGDRVAVAITERHRRYLHARLVHLCSAGPSYRQPPCPFYSSCGGCPWQQVKEETQRAAKVSNLHQSFRRIGGLELPRETTILASPFSWAYRNRIRLHVGERRQLGFKPLRSNEVTAVPYCMVAEPSINAELRAAGALVERLRIELDELELVSAGDGRVVFVASGPGGDLTRADRELATSWVNQHAGVAGIVVALGADRLRFGATDVTAADPLSRQPAEVFSQANREANLLLIPAVLEAAALTGTEQVLELYCGAGNLSLPVARRARFLVAVDNDPAAVAAGRRNARKAGLLNTRFTTGDAASVFADCADGRPDLLILDPPRRGAREVIAAVARAAIPRVVYVSCDLATAARDTAALVNAGYEVRSATAVDLFPQTHHVEVVISAARSPASVSAR